MTHLVDTDEMQEDEVGTSGKTGDKYRKYTENANHVLKQSLHCCKQC